MPTYETSGEHLAAYLRDRHLGANPRAWDELEMVLLPTGRAEHWTAALREMTALHLTHQLIVAGTAIFKRQKAFDTVADRDIKQVIVDTMVVDYPVQALVAGYELTDEKLAELPKEMRFAIQSRAAMQRAKADGTSLKEAFVAIGRPDIPSVVDPGVSVDVFNLTFSAIN